MKQVEIELYLNIGQVGGRKESLILEFDEDATEEEIEEECKNTAKDWAFNFIDYGFKNK